MHAEDRDSLGPERAGLQKLLLIGQLVGAQSSERLRIPSVYAGGCSPGLMLALEGGLDGAAELKTPGPKLLEEVVLSWACWSVRSNPELGISLEIRIDSVGLTGTYNPPPGLDSPTCRCGNTALSNHAAVQ